MGDAQVTMAASVFCSGDVARAAALYAEGLDMAVALDLPHVRSSALVGLGAVAAALEEPAVGARLMGAAEASNAVRGAPMYLSDRPVFERGLATMRAALGETGFDGECAAGRTVDLRTIVAEALAVAAVARG